MRFHVLGLPHTQTTRAYTHCAYTEKLRKFCMMMTSLGHAVVLYAGDENEAPCEELVTCITRDEQRGLIGMESPEDNLKAKFDLSTPYWQLFNQRCISGIKERIQPGDFILAVAGICQQPVANASPANKTVEAFIGYGGVFADYRVFESCAWRNIVAGALTGDAHATNGRFYDEVIPNYYDLDDFPFVDEREDYYFFIGRLIDRKGWRIAQDVCKRLGKRLVVAGQGNFDGYGEHVGVVGPERRSELMGKAQAVFVPSLYLEPFGGVHVESLLMGTPVITTDFGVYPETVVNGVNGYRCRTLGEFMDAAVRVKTLDRGIIRRMAQDRFSLNVVALQYEQYFERLSTLDGQGWYSAESWLGGNISIKETLA